MKVLEQISGSLRHFVGKHNVATPEVVLVFQSPRDKYDFLAGLKDDADLDHMIHLMHTTSPYDDVTIGGIRYILRVQEARY